MVKYINSVLKLFVQMLPQSLLFWVSKDTRVTRVVPDVGM